jgi:glycosyltransferase involved in cell wall biosynthesis
MATVKIAVPCYNEAQRLDANKFKEFECASHDVGFLFVNDGSTDTTRELLTALRGSNSKKFCFLDLAENQGKAEAVRRGLLAAISSGADYVGFWDADLATPLDAIERFVEVAESRRDLEVIIGARVKLLGRSIDRRAIRHYLGRVFATAVSVLLGLDIYDTQCGAKLFRASPSISELFKQPFHSRWIFDVEIIARLIRDRRGKNIPQPDKIIYELPLMTWTDIPGSKLKYGDFVRATWELLGIYKRYVRREGGSRRTGRTQESQRTL